MSETFQAVLDRRRDLLRRRAIWQEVVDHLGIFLDTDASKAKHGIKCETEEMVVPQGTVSDVIDEINNGYLAEISEELNKIDKSEVAENVEKQNKRGSKKSSKSQGRKAAGGKRRPKAAT
jgi:hypothetical protein